MNNTIRRVVALGLIFSLIFTNTYASIGLIEPVKNTISTEYIATESLSMVTEETILEAKSIVEVPTDVPPVIDSVVVEPLKQKVSLLDFSIAQNTTRLDEPNEILVVYKKSPTKIYSIEKNLKAGQLNVKNFNILTSISVSPVIKVVEVQSNESLLEKIAFFTKDPSVLSVQPNFQYYPTDIASDDTHRGLLWGLDNIGQTIDGNYKNSTGITDADIDAPEAWNISEGANARVIVAVIDTGVGYKHPDLINNMWDGANCVDDNGNSLGGCKHGYDFEDNDLDPLPSIDSHGTHVAGIIAASKNNAKGVIGVAPHAKIMALKSSLTTSEIIKAINFAKQNGATIINASFGGSNNDPALREAIASFDGLFVAAAGNASSNTDNNHFYPADFDLDNIVSVAATDQSDNLATFSNYSMTSIDVAAPGVNILGTVAESAILDETFDQLSVPNVPSNWIVDQANSIWGTYVHPQDSNTVLYGDTHFPYTANTKSYIASPVVDLTSGGSPTLSFLRACDTEPDSSVQADFMALETSADGGVSFIQVDAWNESSLENKGTLFEYTIPKASQTNAFIFRFKWVTNASDNAYEGCMIDDVKILARTDGGNERYDYKSGTSMATPFVSGLAALLKAYNVHATRTQIKDALLNTGDTLQSLEGKILTGKRVNAQSALKALAPSTSVSIGSRVYIVGTDSSLGGIISNVPLGVSKQTFLSHLTKGSTYQTWQESGLHDIITVGDTLIVIAENGTSMTYAIHINTDATPTRSTSTMDSPATKRTYIVGETLDLDGLRIIGTYNDGSTNNEIITLEMVSGFDSSTPVEKQVLTVTVGTTQFTFTVDILSAPIPSRGGGGGGSARVIPVSPTTFETIGCTSGNLFSTVTGRQCAPSAIGLPSSPSLVGQVLGVQTFRFSQLLKIGSKGIEVVELQKYLARGRYYYGAADGSFGPKTKTAVIAFQKAQKLTPDGIIGAGSRTILNK